MKFDIKDFNYIGIIIALLLLTMSQQFIVNKNTEVCYNILNNLNDIVLEEKDDTV